ncbi:MAG: hypothetical protein CTY39_11280 [Hyphomicrobium sp.]|nr:MAG: hypothetical protein CTY39_11280 [Hyphomicrobium sp.]
MGAYILNEASDPIDQVSCPADLRKRPLYCEIVDEKRVRPIKALCHYHFGEDYPCGLSSCRTTHRNGYLVETDDGKETNIGYDCGRRYFGASFQVLVNQLSERNRRAATIGTIEKFLLGWPELDGRIHLMRKDARGTGWAQSTPKAMFSIFDKFAVPVLNDMRMRAQKGNSEVTDSMPFTDAEKDEFKAKYPKQKVPQFRNVRLGHLEGLKALITFPDSSLADIVTMHTQLSLLSLETLTSKELLAWSKKIGEVERMLAGARDAIAEAEQFVTDENWKLICQIADMHKAKCRMH